MNHPAADLQIAIGSQRYRADLTRRQDLAIAVNFNGAQPNFFSAPQARTAALQVEGFAGSVAAGASCNCSTHTLTPHCNGTHTECVGHITRDAVSISDMDIDGFLIARLISVQPVSAQDTDEQLPRTAGADDLVITRSVLESAASTLDGCSALIVRTLPNTSDKLERRYSTSQTTPYLTVRAIQWIVDAGVMHLIVDLPSIDRMQDGGRLSAHRTFWGMPASSTDSDAARRPQATITEMAFVPDTAADGLYMLMLQVAAFTADAAPSRPIIYPLCPLSTADART